LREEGPQEIASKQKFEFEIDSKDIDKHQLDVIKKLKQRICYQKKENLK